MFKSHIFSSRRGHRGQASLEAIGMVLILVIIVAAVLGMIELRNHNSRRTEPASSAVTQLNNIEVDLKAATMYDPTAVARLQSAPVGSSWTIAPPTPIPGDTTSYLPSDTQSTTYKIANATANALTLTYTLPNVPKEIAGGSATIPFAQLAPNGCNPLVAQNTGAAGQTSWGVCNAH